MYFAFWSGNESNKSEIIKIWSSRFLVINGVTNTILFYIDIEEEILDIIFLFVKNFDMFVFIENFELIYHQKVCSIW